MKSEVGPVTKKELDIFHTPTYLTDDQLQHLIADVESREMVAAPVDLAEQILAGMVRVEDGGSQKPVMDSQKADRQREFRTYCIRVAASVAACIALLFTVPALRSDLEQPCAGTETPTEYDAQTRERVYTKRWQEDEADPAGWFMGDQKIFAESLGDVHLFSGEHSLGIFRILNGNNGGLME